MSSKTRTLLVAFALLGLVASSISSYVHYQLLTEPNYNSFCDVSARISCTEAYVSRYGSFMGVPVAIGGVIFFGIVALLAGFATKPPARENAAGYVFVLSTVGLAFALYLGWASYFVLRVFCVLCAITYVSVIALFVISGGATTLPMISLPRRASHDLKTLFTSPVALVLLLAVFAGSAALIASFPDEQAAAATQAEAVATYQPLTPEQRGQLEAWWAVQPVVELPVPRSAGMKVQIVKFSDYMCPSCKAAHDAFKPVLAKYQGQSIEFVLKHYPLEPECNVNTPTMNHYGSCEAAAAYEMAKGSPNVGKLDDWLFRNQSTLTKDVVRKAASEEAGINDFDTRYDTALQAVKADVAQGAKLGVNSTPTIYINGRRIPGGGLPPAYYDAIVDMLLKGDK